jgi:hypothetical protein
MKKSTTTPVRYSVRYLTRQEKAAYGYVLQHGGWWLYDWKKKETVRTFEVSEKAQAYAMCKLLNSIEEENDGLSK